jgi:hypothetical protein
MLRLKAAAATTVGALAVLTANFAAPSSAATKARRAVTFMGQCQFTGTSTFGSPVTATPSPVRNDVRASGTCSGSITMLGGRTTALNNSPVQYRAVEFGPSESCTADPDATGRGRLIFQQGSLRFDVVESRVSGQAALGYRGQEGGSAGGVAYVNSPDPAGLLEQCATTGLTSAPVQIVFQTTPTVSG